VRGGCRRSGTSRGADALGMNLLDEDAAVILPQALRLSIPPLVTPSSLLQGHLAVLIIAVRSPQHIKSL